MSRGLRKYLEFLVSPVLPLQNLVRTKNFFEVFEKVRSCGKRGPKKFSLCLKSKGLREKREDGKGKTQW